MSRPKILHVGGILYWTIRTRNPDTMVLKDADSTPTVAVRKNGSSTADSVTVTKRSATTGIYDCSYNPAGEVEGDEFTIEETATVTGTTTGSATYSNSWEFAVVSTSPTNFSLLSVDGSGRVLLQPTQTGVTIPTVTTLTNGVTVSTNNDKTGYSLTQSFPANFASLAITVGGAVTAGTVSDKTGYSLTQSFPSNFASLSVDGSGRVLLQPTQTGVTIPTVTTLTNAVTASAFSSTASTTINAIKTSTDNLATAMELDGSVYRFTVNALEQAPSGGGGGSTDWTADERTAIRAILGIPTSGTTPTDPTSGILDTIRDKVVVLPASFPTNFAALGISVGGNIVGVVGVQNIDDGAIGLGTLDPTVYDNIRDSVWNATLSSYSTAGTAGKALSDIVSRVTSTVKTMWDNLTAMITGSGASAKYTTTALENAPAGGGGGGGGTDWSADERTAIRSILGIPTSGTSPTDPSVGILDTIRDKTALISVGSIPIVSPLTASGKFSGPIIQGDDYLAANGRAFTWTIGSITGITPGTATVRFAGKSRVDNSTFAVSGTVTDLGTGKWTLSCDMTRTVSGALVVGEYDWSVEITSASGTEVTPVRAGSDMIVATKF